MSGFSIDVIVDRDDEPEFKAPLVFEVADDVCLRLPSHETYRRVYLHRLLTAAEAAYVAAGGWQDVLATRDDTTNDLLVDGKRYVLADEPEPEPADTRDVVSLVGGSRTWYWHLTDHQGSLIEMGTSWVERSSAVKAARSIFGNRPNTRLDLGDES